MMQRGKRKEDDKERRQRRMWSAGMLVWSKRWESDLRWLVQLLPVLLPAGKMPGQAGRIGKRMGGGEPIRAYKDWRRMGWDG